MPETDEQYNQTPDLEDSEDGSSSMMGVMLRFRKALIILTHIAMFAAALMAAFLLTNNMSLNREWLIEKFPSMLLFMLPVKLIIFGLFRQYRGWWRYVGISDLLGIAKASVASTFLIMIRYSLIVLGFMLALAGAGVKYSNIAIGMGALGVGIGFGLQNIVANFIFGIILALERPIKIGDVIQVGEVEGEVKDIGMRACQIRSWEGADVFIPNGSLISEKLTNRTFKDRKRRLDLEVRLALKSDISAVSQVVLDAAITVQNFLTLMLIL